MAGPEIELIDGWRLAADTYQWILQKKTKPRKKDGRTYEWKNMSYHRTVEQAVNHLAQSALRDADVKTLGDLLVEAENVTARLSAALSGIFDIEVRINGEKS